MVGITSYGVYVPLWRMDMKAVGMRGEKPIANFDEDSLTMAVAAGNNCLAGMDRSTVDKAFFASTTFPYVEKQGASMLAAACDLPHGVGTADFANSVKGGTTAMLSAADAVGAKSARQVLVAAADMRLGTPMGEFERGSGDGAAAVLMGDTDVVASIECSYSVSDEIMDIWRPQNYKYVQAWEARFNTTAGYLKIGAEVISGLLEKANMKPEDFSKIVLYAPDPKTPAGLAKKMGFDPATQLQDSLAANLRNTGTPNVLMQLTAALDEAKAGDNILVLGYGDGADGLVLKVTDQIEKVQNRKSLTQYMESKKLLMNYAFYLMWRGVLDPEHEKVYYSKYQENTSVPAMWRERDAILRLYGSKCNACGTIQYPPQRVCTKCREKDNYEDIRLADKTGTIFTFAMEYVSTVDMPSVMPIVDFEGGGRADFYMTDRDIKEVKVGMPVEMTFRKLFFDEDIYHYMWKVMPVRI